MTNVHGMTCYEGLDPDEPLRETLRDPEILELARRKREKTRGVARPGTTGPGHKAFLRPSPSPTPRGAPSPTATSPRDPYAPSAGADAYAYSHPGHQHPMNHHPGHQHPGPHGYPPASPRTSSPSHPYAPPHGSPQVQFPNSVRTLPRAASVRAPARAREPVRGDVAVRRGWVPGDGSHRARRAGDGGAASRRVGGDDGRHRTRSCGCYGCREPWVLWCWRALWRRGRDGRLRRGVTVGIGRRRGGGAAWRRATAKAGARSDSSNLDSSDEDARGGTMSRGVTTGVRRAAAGGGGDATRFATPSSASADRDRAIRRARPRGWFGTARRRRCPRVEAADPPSLARARRRTRSTRGGSRGGDAWDGVPLVGFRRSHVGVRG